MNLPDGITEAIQAHDWLRGFVPISDGATTKQSCYAHPDGYQVRLIQVIDGETSIDAEIWWDKKDKHWHGKWEGIINQGDGVLFTDKGKVLFTPDGIMALERKDD